VSYKKKRIWMKCSKRGGVVDMGAEESGLIGVSGKRWWSGVRVCVRMCVCVNWEGDVLGVECVCGGGRGWGWGGGWGCGGCGGVFILEGGGHGWGCLGAKIKLIWSK
jgi:hypothetical protein